MVKFKLKYRKLSIKIAQLLDRKKCEDIIILDISKLSYICYYFVIATANSQTHMKSLENDIFEFCSLKHNMKFNPKLIRYENISPIWHVYDFGGIVIHIMLKETRKFYDLERVWYKSKLIKWQKCKDD